MNIVRLTLFVFLCLCAFSINTVAQSNLLTTEDLSKVDIDNYSDDALASMFNRATQSGLSETQLLTLASQKGLPDSEMAKLKERLDEIINSQELNQSPVTKSTEKDTIKTHVYDTLNLPVQKFKNDESIFGSELFTNNSLVFEPNLRIATPAGYILGSDDELIISVYGYSEKKYDVQVNEQGEIYIPNVGPIFVSGLSIEQATDRIKSKLASTIYRAIKTGGTKIQVTLGKIKSIHVTVIGQAKKPGSFTVSSLTTLFNALYLCGGPTPLGSYRNIEVIRGNIRRTADLYDFLINGNQKDNILLQEGDVVRIPYYKNRVKISGKVKREGKFEMLNSDVFSDLLKYCGGFTDDAYRAAVTVIRITDSTRKIIDIKSSSYDTFKANGSDEYIVRKLQEEYGNRVVVSGSVNRPGPYALTRELTLKDLLEKAGGLTEEAYTRGATIFRYLNNKLPTTLSVDIDSVLFYDQKIYLQKNDSVYIHSIFDFNDKNFITVEGNVRKPGIVPWRENFTLKDLLLSVGGLTESGDSSNIEISRRIKDANVDQANHNESRIFDVNLTNKSSDESNIYLEPYDIVIVKNLPGYTEQRNILLLGEVKSPGRYGLENTGDRISDVLNRAGGLKASADSTSITIRRSTKSNLTVEEKEKLFQRILNINPDSAAQNVRLRNELYKTYDLISVDLTTALAHPESSENLILENGDVLTIDRNSNLVKVEGEVYYPTIIPYKPDKDLKYYIEQAGNFTPYARKSGALVIHPDGKAESVKHFLWFKSYPSVTPRSEIYVPQKIKSNKTKLGTGELALIVSALGILANVIINLTK